MIDTSDVFAQVGIQMIEHGMTKDEVMVLLFSAYMGFVTGGDVTEAGHRAVVEAIEREKTRIGTLLDGVITDYIKIYPEARVQ